MSETIDALLYDMLAWLARGAQPYADVMDAWRTSCPRLTVWEDAVERGLVERAREGGTAMVQITPEGRRFLASR
jgi:predicted transcriptional regulator